MWEKKSKTWASVAAGRASPPVPCAGRVHGAVSGPGARLFVINFMHSTQGRDVPFGCSFSISSSTRGAFELKGL
jgi:hypothetical protein